MVEKFVTKSREQLDEQGIKTEWSRQTFAGVQVCTP